MKPPAPQSDTEIRHSPPLTRLIGLLGSLWVGGLLLMLILVSMACATVYESMYGTQRALAEFYGSWWFVALLLLLGGNVLASLIGRLPITRKRIGFVLTHGGLLVIVVGALLTRYQAIDGQVGIPEGQTVSEFEVGTDVLSVVDRADGSREAVDLPGRVFGGFRVAERPSAPVLAKNGLRFSILRYLPDSTATEVVRNDSLRPQSAVEIVLAGTEGTASTWIFDGSPAEIDGLSATFVRVSDEAELQRRLSLDMHAPESIGTIVVEQGGRSNNIPVESSRDGAVPVGETGYRVRMLRYLPHATVAAGGTIRNASEQPVNPAVELELTAPDGTSATRIRFAKFPEFRMREEAGMEDVKVSFVSTDAPRSSAPLTILAGPENRLYARMQPTGGPATVRELELSRPVETPWDARALTVLRVFDNARREEAFVPVDPVRERRIPAVLVKAVADNQEVEVWLQRRVPRTIAFGGKSYELTYGDKTLPLGFDLRLEDFRIRYYPGSRRPRSFESEVAITDPESEDVRTRVVSMNHPLKFAGYTLFQSSYQLGPGPEMTILSVSRDPGLPVVYAGYVMTIVGMFVVLANRLSERRRLSQLAAKAGQK